MYLPEAHCLAGSNNHGVACPAGVSAAWTPSAGVPRDRELRLALPVANALEAAKASSAAPLAADLWNYDAGVLISAQTSVQLWAQHPALFVYCRPSARSPFRYLIQTRTIRTNPTGRLICKYRRYHRRTAATVISLSLCVLSSGTARRFQLEIGRERARNMTRA